MVLAPLKVTMTGDGDITFFGGPTLERLSRRLRNRLMPLMPLIPPKKEERLTQERRRQLQRMSLHVGKSEGRQTASHWREAPKWGERTKVLQEIESR